MQSRAISKIIILGAIALVGMLFVQGVWLANSLDSRKRQFSQNVQAALQAASTSIIKYNEGDITTLQPIEQLSSNYFVVPINDAIQPSLLKSVLLSEFNRRNIRETFEFSIYDCSNEKIVFGSYISQNDQALINSEFPDITKDDYYFSVLFPNISFQLINEMSIWLSSSFILLLIVSVFVYTVVALFRQKKLADFQRDFINNMAHEFKTPLAAIGASSEMMLHEEMESNRRQQHISLINKETVRLTHQVDQFLQISKLDKASPELNITSINLQELITACANQFSWLIKKQNGTVDIELPKEEIYISTDKSHLSYCVHNLIDNAIKYGGRPPKVLIELGREGNCKISITDNGMGISKADRNFIFDKFYRISTGNIHDVKGFGLGLYYVKMMTKLLGGNSHLGRSDDSGSTFVLEINDYEK